MCACIQRFRIHAYSERVRGVSERVRGVSERVRGIVVRSLLCFKLQQEVRSVGLHVCMHTEI